MKHSLLLIASVAATVNAAALTRQQNPAALSQTDSIIARYSTALNTLAAANTADSVSPVKMPSPYMFQIFGPGTLYRGPLAQSFGTQMPLVASASATALPALGQTGDPQLALSSVVNERLARAYAESPALISSTQEELAQAGPIRSELSAPVVESEVKLADKIEQETIQIDVEPVEPEVKRPNFWTFKGNGGLQFTQSYFSKNWYQGGENNYAMLGLLSFDANYNNQRRVQLDNKLEAQLGFQTSESSDPKFRPTSNLLRFTSNLGIKAIGNWNYAAQLQLQTQPYMSYNGSTREVTGDFVSPLYVRASIGMDFKIKKPKFEGTLKLAPLSYVITYVERKSLIGRYGIHEGHHSKHEWGPNVEFRFKYNIVKNISWESRLYWFSNLNLTRIENENTINFTINKYLSTKLFLYPRYEDTKYYNVSYDADGNRTEDSARETHWMFKEFFSLGLNYDF